MFRIVEQAPLAQRTTFRIGGSARYFCEAATVAELKKAIGFARRHGVPFFILGCGSNVLFSDDGFNGLVITMTNRGSSFKQEAESVLAVVEAGENWDSFVGKSTELGLFGIENLSAIPGSVGAAPVQNIGAYGQEVKDTLAWVDVFDTEREEVARLENAECRFGYRDSIFKTEAGRRFVIIQVAFRLCPSGKVITSYRGVLNALEKENISRPTPADMRRIITAIRADKLPDVSRVGTAGSFFKNPVVLGGIATALAEQYPDMPRFRAAADGGVKLSAAWLIEHLSGMKGARRGDAGVYENQAIVLVNTGSARADDILYLAEEIEQKIFARTGIKLEREVQVVQ
ncbi:MAG: UDP-N-acetylenolpyruvoylglucosamine reductase [Candidatus Lloydbacteria bacterium CG22_combo_CG10-13_8_21_14_all_47_15]|uniref:UDP-N-acetylenolpyruvoylglucosamine reductase n=1 Tax=Candidatus Lloydbacteria bacterium CG22_combo_CG10-13_8_21_14_all_47_15 TaxID=1974635 RepID=A0A2H0CW88_9BACT|nr:MAG: UDP-N-acetylenolpyruvoylglucosamine reductase [Candidatus Lloydbacteria bacterium CG22_combo_CG10-13_8_21_14_all_47_15]